ncbi:MAG: TadE/TadG family type IV pilus assembly protein, partial [Acidimicrobiales bacterium]
MEQTDVLRSRRRDEGGSSVVEFALVVTLLCTLLLGVVVFGLL